MGAPHRVLCTSHILLWLGNSTPALDHTCVGWVCYTCSPCPHISQIEGRTPDHLHRTSTLWTGQGLMLSLCVHHIPHVWACIFQTVNRNTGPLYMYDWWLPLPSPPHRPRPRGYNSEWSHSTPAPGHIVVPWYHQNPHTTLIWVHNHFSAGRNTRPPRSLKSLSQDWLFHSRSLLKS